MRFRLQALCNARIINIKAGVISWQYGYAHFNYGIRLTDIKKRDSAESQPFVNLKSNTMKNTLQSY